MLKIISGTYRSRRLIEPGPHESSRPYSNRAKESIFNHLRGWLDDAHVLDLFAGVGTMGLEAISRGAKEVLMVEQNLDTFKRLRENIETLGCTDRANAMNGDALAQACLFRAPQPVQIVFVDPPYSLMRAEGSRERVMAQVAVCRTVMDKKGWLILRTPMPPDGLDLAVDGFDGPEAHQMGAGMWVLFYAVKEDDPGNDPEG